MDGETKHTYLRIQEKGLSFNDGMSNSQLYWIVFGFAILTVFVLFCAYRSLAREEAAAKKKRRALSSSSSPSSSLSGLLWNGLMK